LAKVAVQCSASTFVVKIAAFAKRQNVGGHAVRTLKTKVHLQNNKYYSKFVK
jgi:hypothetical protein